MDRNGTPGTPILRRCGQPEDVQTPWPGRGARRCAGTVARPSQSPNIFCLSSRRCCASSDSVAVGRASSRPRPIGSPVSSQIAVVAALDAGQRLRDLLEQLALAVARAQLQRVLFLDRGAVGRVGHDRGVLAQMLGGLAGVGQQVVLQLPAAGRGRSRAASRSCTPRRASRAARLRSGRARPCVFQALASLGSALCGGAWASTGSVISGCGGRGGAKRSVKRCRRPVAAGALRQAVALGPCGGLGGRRRLGAVRRLGGGAARRCGSARPWRWPRAWRPERPCAGGLWPGRPWRRLGRGLAWLGAALAGALAHGWPCAAGALAGAFGRTGLAAALRRASGRALCGGRLLGRALAHVDGHFRRADCSHVDCAVSAGATRARGLSRLARRAGRAQTRQCSSPCSRMSRGQVDADEDHLAALLFAGRPLRAEVAAHQLVHALEDHLAVAALHVQHALVAQHLRAVDLHDRAQEVLQLGRR